MTDRDLAEWAWTIICNVDAGRDSKGNWNWQAKEWRDAANAYGRALHSPSTPEAKRGGT